MDSTSSASVSPKNRRVLLDPELADCAEIFFKLVALFIVKYFRFAVSAAGSLKIKIKLNEFMITTLDKNKLIKKS